MICLGAVFDPSSDSIEISIVRPPFVTAMGSSAHVLIVFLRRPHIPSPIQTLMLLFVTIVSAEQ